MREDEVKPGTLVRPKGRSHVTFMIAVLGSSYVLIDLDIGVVTSTHSGRYEMSKHLTEQQFEAVSRW